MHIVVIRHHPPERFGRGRVYVAELAIEQSMSDTAGLNHGEAP